MGRKYDENACELYDAKGKRRIKCRVISEMSYRWTDELGQVGNKGDPYDLRICFTHLKLDPGPLDALCKLTVQIQKEKAP
jgi:hypothetical protein